MRMHSAMLEKIAKILAEMGEIIRDLLEIAMKLHQKILKMIPTHCLIKILNQNVDSFSCFGENDQNFCRN